MKDHFEQESLDGLNELPEEFQTVIRDSFEQGVVVEPPTVIPATPVTKSKKRGKKTADGEGEDGEHASASKEIAAEPASKKKRGRTAKQVISLELSKEGTKAEHKTEEAVDPMAARIKALADNMRAEAEKPKRKLPWM